MNSFIPVRPAASLPALVKSADDHAQTRFLEFFAVTIRNPNTRRAYVRATDEFLGWCAGRGVASIAAVQPLHVAGYVEELGRMRSAPTVKLRLAAVRHLFDWLVVGQVAPFNPAASVRGPSHSVRRWKTPVLTPAEARQLWKGVDRGSGRSSIVFSETGAGSATARRRSTRRSCPHGPSRVSHPI